MLAAHAIAFWLILLVLVMLWRRIRRLEGCIRWLVRRSEAHMADAEALAEVLDEVAAKTESWENE